MPLACVCFVTAIHQSCQTAIGHGDRRVIGESHDRTVRFVSFANVPEFPLAGEVIVQDLAERLDLVRLEDAGRFGQ